MNNQSRRQFLTAAGGLTLAFSIPGFLRKYNQPESRSRHGLFEDQEINAWVQINLDGKIKILSPAAEMGQGSMTALAIVIAEEMDADWADVHIEHAPIEPDIYGLQWNGSLGGPMITVGSRTVRGYYKNLRHAGAQVRYALMTAVANHENIDPDELSTEPSLIVHKKSGKSWSYGQAAALQMPTSIPEIPERSWKRSDDFRLIGKQIQRSDIPAKVDGSAQFAIDVHLPGMVYAAMERSPVYGESPRLTNQSDIEALPGVLKIVELGHGIAVVAKSFEEAQNAKKQCEITWSQDGKARPYNSVAAYAKYEDLTRQTDGGEVLFEQGEITSTSLDIDRTYKNDFAYHAQMEPLNAVVHVSEDGREAEAWVGSQSTDGARRTVAKVLGIPFESVVLYPCYLGGGFGRRSMSDYLEEATIIAKEVKKPLKLIWSREDDMKYGAFRPISVQHLTAHMNHSGHISSWKHVIAGTGGGLMTSGITIPYYKIPNQLIIRHNVDEGVRTKHWRSVGHGPNKFAIETFIDEMCFATKVDPLSVRQKLLVDSPRELKVVNTVAEMCDWGAQLPTNRGRGMAFGERSGALVAGVAEISLEQNKIKVHRFWCAMDAGVVVHPDNAIAQLEGGIIFGMSSVLKESLTFKDGQVAQSNFHDYALIRISEVPESMDIRIIPSDEPPMGVGEASLPVVGGAIANAFLALTGKAIRHMPFTPERVREALAG